MPLPWLSIIDGVLGATDLVRRVKGRASTDLQQGGGGRLEARLAGVVVSAVKEAFNRDAERLEFERQRLDEERDRQERLMRLEWLRQAGEREIARYRVITAVAVVSWIGTLVAAPSLAAAGTLAHLMLGFGWAFLLGALGGALSAQGAIGRALSRADDRTPLSEVTTSATGVAAPWMIVAGIALIAVGMLSM